VEYLTVIAYKFVFDRVESPSSALRNRIGLFNEARRSFGILTDIAAIFLSTSVVP